MNTNRLPISPLTSTIAIAMSPLERSLGRVIRDGNGHQPNPTTGGNDSGGGGNNPAVNPGNPGTGDGNQNNASTAFDAEAFWNGAGDEDGGAPSGESVTQPNPTPASPQQQPNPGQALAERLNAMNFGEVMTPDIMAKLGEGDPQAFNQGIQQFGQTIVRMALTESVGIMKQLRDQIFSEVDQRINGRATTDKQYEALTQAIPSAADPKMGPTIKNAYERALVNTKGNISKAIENTKEVLRIQAEMFGADLGLTVAPRTPEDSYAPPKKTNWLEELAGN